MERDLSALLGEGWSREGLAGAVLHSVRDNYLSQRRGKSGLGDTIVFQGATARNRALVSAFEQQLGSRPRLASATLPARLAPRCSCRDEGPLLALHLGDGPRSHSIRRMPPVRQPLLAHRRRTQRGRAPRGG